MQKTYYIDKLYPVQDKVLHIVENSNAEFYLTGGTALGRFYLQHRHSDDLDLFLNAHPDFKLHHDLSKIHDDIFYGRVNSLSLPPHKN